MSNKSFRTSFCSEKNLVGIEIADCIGATTAFITLFNKGICTPFEKVTNKREKESSIKTEITTTNFENLFIIASSLRYNKTRISSDNLVHYGE
ncbi:hypothetical protein GUT184_00220 [Streptococcus ruminantium]|nr:hypothetical protein GUT184_00220 [Streptococcus ruminantium]